uniref:Gamma-gliadin-like n=1 Tax=Nicotiana tabacum TaxID=4097 RepID=A0A1S4D5M7_TOBAC|nr:PREDICTED: gamma-gliadin-like [Nicotiana tabacum]
MADDNGIELVDTGAQKQIVEQDIGPPDVVEPRQRQDPVGVPAQRFHPQHRPHEYPRTPDNPTQCYFFLKNPQSHTSPFNYSIHNASPYAPHPQDPQRFAPPPQMPYIPLQAYQPPTRKRFQPSLEYKMKGQQQRESPSLLLENHMPVCSKG